MPIRRDLRTRYPVNWKALSRVKRAAAGNRCQLCGKPDASSVLSVWDGTGRWGNPDTGEWRDGYGKPTTPPPATLHRTTRVVLATCHYPDPSPENCQSSNLLCLCQGCHIRIDRQLRAHNRHITLLEKRDPLQTSMPPALLDIPTLAELRRPAPQPLAPRAEP